LEAVFILLEPPSPSRRIFIGSHSLPPSLVRHIGPSMWHRFLAQLGRIGFCLRLWCICCDLGALELDGSVVLDLIVKVLGTQLLHAMYHIPCPHTFGVIVLDEWDGVFC
jgi:hypothetical protein